MSGKVLFACSKCFSRHPFEELSSGQQLCKNCRSSNVVVKCSYCRSEYQGVSNKSQNVCKKCEHSLSKYGKPSACECCNIVAAFGNSKCVRCATYEAKYGPPVPCEECKQRSAFDKREENKKVNGKLLCWLCTSAFKRALLKAQQEGRISTKKRPHEKSHRESSSSAKKSSRTSDLSKSSVSSAVSGAGLDVPDKVSRTGSGGSGGGSNSGVSGSAGGSGVGGGVGGSGSSGGGGGGGSNGMLIAAPAVISIDPNSADHVVAMTNLKERIASLEKRLILKDKDLLEKDKQLTELKGKNFEKEIEMRNKLKENDRLHDMKVENLNKKVTSLLREIAGLKKAKKNGVGGGSAKDRLAAKEKRASASPKEEPVEEKEEKEEVKEEREDEREEKNSSSSDSRSNSPNSN